MLPFEKNVKNWEMLALEICESTMFHVRAY